MKYRADMDGIKKGEMRGYDFAGEVQSAVIIRGEKWKC